MFIIYIMENTKTALEFIDSEEPKKYIIGLFVFILKLNEFTSVLL